ncbi:MAG: hypothetical protein LBU23_05430, partial [Planctomycetota bacterium]|nr:hypothetical protein [Planctomycetota bacterium]
AYAAAGFDMARLAAGDGRGGAAAGGEGGAGGEGLELTAGERRRLAEWGRKVQENGGREGGADAEYLRKLAEMPFRELQVYLLRDEAKGLFELFARGGGVGSPGTAETLNRARGGLKWKT